jgi:hypothetical protein
MESDTGAGEGYAADRLEESRRIVERTRALTGDLGEAQLYWPQPDRGWSVAQVFEHLVRINESYLAPLGAAIERARRAGGAGGVGRPWKPSFFGRLLIGSSAPEAKRRMKAPKLWSPEASIRRDVVDAFLDTQTRLDRLLAEADGLDLNRIRLGSPAMKLIRLNAGDVFVVLNLHALRHLNQVERIRQRPEFPAG